MAAKKSFFDDIVGKVQSQLGKKPTNKTPTPSVEVEGEVDHLWMSEDRSQIRENPVTKRDPRIDTGILKDRTKEKLAKLDNNPA